MAVCPYSCIAIIKLISNNLTTNAFSGNAMVQDCKKPRNISPQDPPLSLAEPI